MNAFLLFLSTLQDPPAETQAPAGGPNMIFMLGGMFVIMYFLWIRPQGKERKKRQAMLAAIKKGDKVVTSSGIYGTIASISEHDVVLKVDEKNNIRVRFTRQAVNSLVGDPQEEVVEAK
jgi:preprotein translocase subunit YajC